MKTICAWDNFHCLINNPPNLTLGVLIAVILAVLAAWLFADRGEW